VVFVAGVLTAASPAQPGRSSVIFLPQSWLMKTFFSAVKLYGGSGPGDPARRRPSPRSPD
jgi:hypothetical protein